VILVDTSVWIEYLRAGNDRLKSLLLDEQVLCHPLVIGELACGTLQKRNEILTMIKALPQPQCLEYEEVLNFIETGICTGVVWGGWMLTYLLPPC
jgi:predicted nucleic acid-binding protein